MAQSSATSFPDFLEYAQHGTVGVILATLVVSAGMIALYRFPKQKPSDRQILMFLGFFVIVTLVAFGRDFFAKTDGPWVFVGTIQSSSRQIHADNSTLYAFLKKDEQDLPIEYVFYISHTEIKEGNPLQLPLLEPQPGQARHNAWVCFTKQPNSYNEVSLESGDVQLEPHGAGHSPLCGPPKTAGAWSIFPTAIAETVTLPPFVYTPTDVPGLCSWQSTKPTVVGTTLVICNPDVLG